MGRQSQQGLSGYRVYRLDGRYDKEPVSRLTASPIAETSFTDATAGKDSRRYYIIAVDGQRINSPQDLVRIVSRMEPGSDVEIEFTRRQRDSTSVTLGSQGERQDGSFSLTEERRSNSSQRSASRSQFEDEDRDEFRD